MERVCCLVLTLLYPEFYVAMVQFLKGVLSPQRQRKEDMEARLAKKREEEEKRQLQLQTKREQERLDKIRWGCQFVCWTLGQSYAMPINSNAGLS